MKKLIFLLFFIPLMSIGQIVIYDTYKTVENVNTWDATTTVTSDTLNITEIQDEFIQVKLFAKKENAFSTGQHLLILSENRNIMLGATYKYKYWNVYDGDKLIPLKNEIDVLNYFDKYGFELFKTDTKNARSSSYTYFSKNQSFTSTNSKSKLILTFKNNNN